MKRDVESVDLSPSLSGKVAIVTGASRGIGAAIALRLARDGANIVVGYARNSDAATDVVARIRSENKYVSAIACQADMGDPTQIEELFARVDEHYGRLDILVNNAGIASRRKLDAINIPFYEDMFNVNVRGPLLAMRLARERFNQTGGRIVNISSTGAHTPTSEWAVYAASKAALEMLTACLALELGPLGVTANAVAPGVTRTDLLNEVIPATVQQKMSQKTALGRLGEPEDIADVVAFLCGHDGRWITGQTIIVSGGLT